MINPNRPSLSLSDLPNVDRSRSINLVRPDSLSSKPYNRMHTTPSFRLFPSIAIPPRTLSTTSNPDDYRDAPGNIVPEAAKAPLISAASSARQLDDSTIQNFRAVFSHYDSDGDDLLSIGQLRQVVSLLTNEEPLSGDNSDHETTALHLACNILDDDPLPESITFPQFLNFFAAYENDKDEDLHASSKEIFQQLDPDSSGFITTYTLHNILNYFGFKISMDQASSMTDYVATTLDATHFTSKQLTQALSDAKESHVTLETIFNPNQSQASVDTSSAQRSSPEPNRVML